MTTKQTFLNASEQLPEQQLIEVLQYVQRLSHAQESTVEAKSDRPVDLLSKKLSKVL